MIQVYHNANAISGNPYISFFKNESITILDSQLTCVAEVNTDDLDVAYALTNTKEKYWWINELVIPRFSGIDCRSTSVGDVLKLNGIYYAVAPFGFVPVQITSN